MPINYYCDICGNDIDYFHRIQILGSKKIAILCGACWKPIEDQLPRKETANAHQK